MTASELTQEAKRLRRTLLGVWFGDKLATHYNYGSWGAAIQMHDVFRDNCNPATTHYTIHDPETGMVTFPVVVPYACDWLTTRKDDLRYVKGVVRNGGFVREAFYGPFKVVDVQRRLVENISGHKFIHGGQFYWLPLSRDKQEAA
jgi:hypothetical protein